MPDHIDWYNTFLDAIRAIADTSIHLIRANQNVINRHVRNALPQDMAFFNRRARQVSPKRTLAGAHLDDPPTERSAKRPSPSPSTSSQSSNGVKRRHDGGHDGQSTSPMKRRSMSPEKQLTRSQSQSPTRVLRSQSSRASMLEALSTPIDTPSDASYKDNMREAWALANRLENTNLADPPPERPNAKAIKARARASAQKEQQAAEQLVRRAETEKRAKKVKAGLKRRQQEREARDRQFRLEKEAYERHVAETLQSRATEQALEDQRRGLSKKSPPSSRHQRRLVTPITEQWHDKVKAALAIRSDAVIIGKSVDGIEVSRYDLKRLLPEGEMAPGREPWLNDEVVNAWYANLCGRLNELDGYVKGPNAVPKYAAYPTQWYKSASERGVDSIKNWSRRKGIKNEKLLQVELIFFPICNHSHWTLLAIGGRARTIQYLDSLSNAGWEKSNYINMARRWLQMELGAAYRPDEWRVLQTKSSQQCNANDCGMFTCLNGMALSRGSTDPSTLIEAREIPDARRLFVAMLLNGGFKGDFDIKNL